MPARDLSIAAVVAVLLAIQSLFYSVSYASLIFAGPLEPLRGHGVVLALAGSLIYAAFSAVDGRTRGIWYGNQSITAVAIAIGMGALAALDWQSQPALFATAFLMVVASTSLTGAVMWALGQFRLAGLVRIIPHPVIGGFLAVTGVFLVMEAALIVLPGANDPAMLLQADRLWHWLPFPAAAVVMVAFSRILPHALILPVTISVYIAGFLVWLFATGTTLETARATGLLLDPGGALPGLWEVLGAQRLAGAEPARLVPLIPAILSVPALAILSALMNLSAIELMRRQPIDLNRAFRAAGWSSFLTGLLGGLPGFQSASTMELTHGIRVRWALAASLAGALLALVLLFGRGLIGLLPIGIFALMLTYVGVAILWRWLVDEARRMSAGDNATVWLILAVALVFGIIPAVAVGILTATVMFAVAYSRVDVVRSGLSGRQRLSNAERSEEEVDLILAHGEETLIYELHGYLFFGTADRLFMSVTRAIESAPRPVRRVIFDLRRVVGLDTSSANMFGKLAGFAARHGVEVAISGPSPDVADRLRVAGVGAESVRVFASLTDALDWVETAVLSGNGGPIAARGHGFAELFRRVIAVLPPAAQSARERELEEGEVLFERGARSHSLFFLADGRLSARIAGHDGVARPVAVFMPGAVVGEMGFYTGEPRSATVVADAPSRLIVIASEDIERIAAEDAEMLAEFHAAIAGLLARRLGRTTALAVALDR